MRVHSEEYVLPIHKYGNYHVNAGRAEWLDKNHRKCLILWRRIEDWADSLLNFVRQLIRNSHSVAFKFDADGCRHY